MFLFESFGRSFVWLCTRDYIIYTLINQLVLRVSTDRNVNRKCDLLATSIDRSVKALTGNAETGQIIESFRKIEILIDELDVEKELLLIPSADVERAIDETRAILQATDPLSSDSFNHPNQRVLHLKTFWGVIDDKIALPTETLKSIRANLRSYYPTRVAFWLFGGLFARLKRACRR